MRIFTSTILMALIMNLPAADLDQGEWFIGADPGVGNANLFPSSANSTVQIPVAVVDALDEGVHLLGIRIRDDAGRWGHTVFRAFLRESDPPESAILEQGEWFIGEDPGVGVGTAFTMNASPSQTDIPAAELDGLFPGVHLLGVRVKDSKGRWGHTVWRAFFKDDVPEQPAPIAAFEYRILRDALMVGDGNQQVAPAEQEVTATIQHGKSGLSLENTHQVEVFPLDENGKRGHSVFIDFDYLRYSDAWMMSHFTAEEMEDPGISGDDVDADGDGLSNRFERLFGLNPRDASDGPKASSGIEKTAEGLQLAFRVPAGGTLDMDGKYRTSNLEYSVLEGSSPAASNHVPAEWIESWSLDQEEDGSGLLQLRLMAPSAEIRFFRIMAMEETD